MEIKKFTLLTMMFICIHLLVNAHGLSLSSKPNSPTSIAIARGGASLAGEDKTVCSDTTSLAATVGPGVWTGTGGVRFSDPSAQNSIVYYLLPGPNVLTWTLKSGGSYNVTIYNNQILSNPYTNGNQTVCTSGVDLFVETSGIGSWSLVSGSGVIEDINSTNTNVTGLSLGLNLFRWTEFSGGCSVTADVNVINSTPSDAISDATITVCCADAQLHAQVPTVGTGFWTTSTSGLIYDQYDPNSYVKGITAATNPATFFWNVSNGVCLKKSTTIVTSNLLNFVGAEQIVCSQTASLKPTLPDQGPGVWISAGSAIVDNPSQQNSTVRNLKYGSNVFRWVPQTGVEVIENIVSNLEIAYAGEFHSVCGYAELNGNGTSGLWTESTGKLKISSPAEPKARVSDLVFGSNKFTWTINHNGCSSSADVEILNNQVPPFADVSINVCGTSSQLSATLPANGTAHWEPVENNSIIENIADPNSKVTQLEYRSNQFFWVVEYNGCSSNSNVYINNEQLYVDAGPNMTVCDVDNTGLKATFNYEQGYGEWSSNNPNIYFGDASYANSSVSGLEVGSNILYWSSINGSCIYTSSVNVYRENISSFITSADPDTICSNSVTLLARNIPGATGHWVVAQGSGTGTISSPNSVLTNVSGIESGLNFYSWEMDRNGCKASNNNIVYLLNGTSPSIANAGTDITTTNGAAQLTANVPTVGVGTWYAINSGEIISPQNNKTWVDKVGAGNNFFKWKIRNGICSSSSYVNVKSSATSVCSAEATLEAIQPSFGSGKWSIASSQHAVILDPTYPSSGVANLDPGLNGFKWSADNGAKDTLVYIYRSLTAPLLNAGIDQTVCTTSVSLSAETASGVTSVWSLPSGLTADNINAPNAKINNLQPGLNQLKWLAINDGCISSKQVNITYDNVTQPSVAFAGTSVAVCAETTNLNASVPANGVGTWSIVNGTSVVLNSNLANSQVQNLSLGKNTFKWTVQKNTCSTESFVDVYNNSPSIAQAGVSVASCSPTAVLSATVPAIGSGSWSLVSGAAIIVNASNANTSLANLGAGSNLLRWTVALGGCSTTSDVVVNNDQPSVASAANTMVTLCSNNTVLTAIAPSKGVGMWSIAAGGANLSSFSANNPTLTNINSGSNAFRWTVTNNACSSDVMVYVINNTPSVANAGTSVSTCVNYANLNALSPSKGTGVWSVVSGNGIFANASSNLTTVTNLNAGQNIFRWTVSNSGCMSISDLVVLNDQPSIANAGASVVTCSSIATLNAESPSKGIGVWSVVSGSAVISNVNSNSSTVSNLSTTSNVFRWTVTNNSCSSFSDVNVVNDLPSISDAGASVVSCSNTATLNAVPPSKGTGTWSLYAGSGTIVNPLANNSSITGLGSGMNAFKWTVVNNTCSSLSYVTVINNQPSTATASNVSGCSSTANLAGNIPTIGTGAWTLSSGSGTIATPTAYNSVVSSLALGTNVFTWTITNNSCSNSVNVNVVNDQPSVASAGNVASCSNTATLNASVPTNGTGTWSLFSGSGTITNVSQNNSSVTNLGAGNNIFRWTVVKNACSNYVNAYVVNDVPSVADAGASVVVCTNSTTLNAIAPTKGTGLWSIQSGAGTFANLSSNTSSVTNIGTGVNVFKWTVTNNACSSEALLTIKNDQASNAVAGADFSVCSSSASLNATPPTKGTGIWSVVSGGATIINATLFNTPVTNLSNGLSKLRWTVAYNSCSNYSEVNILNTLPSVAYAGSSQEVCSPSVNLSALAPTIGSGQWTQTFGTGTISNALSNTTSVSGLQNGLNQFRWTVSNGSCSSSSDVSIYNHAVVAQAGASVSSCSSIANLNALSPVQGTGFWNVLSGSSIVTDGLSRSSSVTNLSLGMNTFKWTVALGSCSSTSNTTIFNNEVAAYAGSGSTVCVATGNLNATIPTQGTGLWTVAGGSAIVVSPTLNTSQVTNLSAGNNVFNWTVSKDGCSSVSQVTIANNSFNVNAGADLETCGTTIQLAASVNEPGVWAVTTGSGTFNSSSVYNPIVTNLGQGLNTFRWVVTKNGCTAYDLVNINNNAPSIAIAGNDQSVCNSNTSLNATVPALGSGVWSSLSSAVIANPTLANTPVTSLPLGKSKFTWIVSSGACSSFSDIYLTNNSVVAAAGSTTSTCSNTGSLYASAPQQGSGTWSVLDGGGVITNSNSPLTSVSGLYLGSNTFRWTVSLGQCSAFSNTVIRNDAVAASAGASSTVCSNYGSLNAVTPVQGTGIWSKLAGDGVIANPSNMVSSVTGLGVGVNVFNWTVVLNNCSASSQAILTNNSFSVSAGSDFETCANAAQLNAPVNEPGVWSMVYGSGTFITNKSLSTVRVSGLAQGINTFRWDVSKNGCSAFGLVNVTNNTPSVADAGANQSICLPNAVLNANIPSSGTGVWTTLSEAVLASPTMANTSVSGIPQGSTTFTWTITNGICSSSSSVVVTNSNVVADAGSTMSICGGNAFLNANNPNQLSGQWTVLSGSSIISNPTNANTSVSNLSVGNNYYKWTVSQGNCSSSSNVIIRKDLVSASAGSSQNVCSTSAVLNAVIPAIGTGHWTSLGTAVIDSPSNANTNVSNLSYGNNTFTWTVTNGTCSSSSDVVITSNYLVADAGASMSNCSSIANLNAQPPTHGTGQWSVLSGAAVVVEASNPASSITGLSFGMNYFKWTVSDGVCSNSSVTSILNNGVNANAGSNQIVCSNSANLKALQPSQGIGSWSVLGGSAIIVNPTQNNTPVSNLSSGNNIFKWTVNQNSCSSSSQVVITNNSFVVNAGADFETCGTIAQLSAAVEEPGFWSLTSGLGELGANPSNYSVAVTGLGLGLNTFTWNVTRGSCSASASVNVTNNTPSSVSAGLNQKICVSNTSLNGTSISGASEVLWSSLSTASILSPNTTATDVANLSPGDNLFTFTVSKGACTATSKVTVTFNPVSLAQATASVEVCCGNVQLNAVPPVFGVGYWTSNGPAMIDHPTMADTKAYGLVNGMNQFTWTVSNGACSSHVNIPVTNKGLLIAKFNYTVAGNTVTFINQSEGNPDRFSWDYGNGISETVESPVYTYKAAGLYNVSFSINNSQTGIVDMVTQTVVVGNINNLVSDFEYTTNLAGAIQFKDNSQGVPTNYLWDFGDGETSTVITPTHRYAKAGSYLACLFVSDPSRKLQDGNCKMVTAGAETVQADFSFFVDLNNQTIFTDNTLGAANKWFWNFGDGQYTNDRNTSHLFKKPGSYQVCLTAIDSISKAKSTNCKKVDIRQFVEADHLLAQFSYFKKTGTDSTLLTSETIGTYSSLSWDFGDGSVGYGEKTSHIYTQSGSYNVCLHVFDKINNLYSDACNVLEFKLNNTTLITDFNSVISTGNNLISFSDLSKGTPIRWRWDYGDGSSDTIQNPNHTYAKIGAYKVCLTTSNGLAYSEKCKEIQINGSKLVSINPDFNYIINIKDSTVVFSDKSTGYANKWNWNFGNGLNSQATKPIVKYSKSGVYEVCLQMQDSISKAIGEKCKELSVDFDTKDVAIAADFVYFVETAKPIVTFRNKSTGNPTNWYWTYGDGVSGEGETVSHLYKNPGIYDVCLNVYNSTTKKYNQSCRPVSVGNSACSVVADFSFYVDNKTKNVTFLNKSKGNASQYFWIYGDGGTSSEQNPVYNFKEAKSYQITLSAADQNKNCIDVQTKTLEIGQVDCNADFRYTIAPKTNAITLYQKSIGKIDNYRWEFGDGSLAEGETVTHVYATNGAFKVNLKIKGSTGCIDEKTNVLQVGDVNCNADFVYYIDSLTNSIEVKPIAIGNTTNYYWDFGDGANSIIAQASHQYQAAAFYTVGLTAKNADGSCMDHKEISLLVGNRLKDVQADFIANNDPDGKTITFINKSIGDNLRYIWDFNDQTASTDKNPSPHQYAKLGYYNVCLTAIGNQRMRNMTCKEIRVAKTDTVLSHSKFYFDADVSALKANFINQSTGEPNHYFWDFGDGVTSSDRNPSHIYAKTGLYLVALTATNSLTNSSNVSYQVINMTYNADFGALFHINILPKTNKTQGYPVDIMGAAHGKPALKVWDFGDGTKDSTSTNPLHVYQKPGTYIVSYTVIDPVTGKSSTTTQTIVITALPDDHILNVSTDLYPNPNQGGFILRLEGDKIADYLIEVVNTQAQVLISDRVENTSSFERKYQHELKRGLYLVRIRSANQFKTIKMIVE